MTCRASLRTSNSHGAADPVLRVITADFNRRLGKVRGTRSPRWMKISYPRVEGS